MYYHKVAHMQMSKAGGINDHKAQFFIKFSTQLSVKKAEKEEQFFIYISHILSLFRLFP